MDARNLTYGVGVQLDWECRDIGYGIESGEGVYIYRSREQFGKHAFESVTDGELIYLFDDEILEVSPAERTLFEIVVEAYRKPTTANWQRFAYTREQAEREAIGAGETEWPDAVTVRATVLGPVAVL